MGVPTSAVDARRRARRTPNEVLAWLKQGPSLSELRDAYPAEWDAVEQELATLSTRDADEVAAYVAAISMPLTHDAHTRRNRSQQAALLSEQIRRVMVATVLQKATVAAASGVRKGKVRFNLLNGYLAQKLLFARKLERKPVSLLWFRVLWPLLWQRRLLMPLVQPKGIYCFYSKQLIGELAALIGDRRCLEIAAGDGTLARFLAAEGVDVVATDDYSWDRYVTYPKDVLRQDARRALRAQRPGVVVCSWPPPGNDFERHVFRTASVELYIVINGGDDSSSGNPTDYAQQSEFELVEEPRLGRLVLPPELESRVQLFRRKRGTD